MKALRFGLFASTKNINENINTYKKIADIVRAQGIIMYNPGLVDNYDLKNHNKYRSNESIVDGTQRQIRSIDFAIAYFTNKSRTVFYQTILALENKIPVLCLVSEEKYNEFPETLLAYGDKFITVRKYNDIIKLENIITNYVKELDPPKKRFNVVLKTKTLKQMQQLSTKLEISKAELIRWLVDKEFTRLFGDVS